jgi:hypothetical protein
MGWSVLNGLLPTEEHTTSPDIKRFIDSSLWTEIAGGCKELFAHPVHDLKSIASE